MKDSSPLVRMRLVGTELEEEVLGRAEGRVAAMSGISVDVIGLAGLVAIGDRVAVAVRDGLNVKASIVGFAPGVCQAMSYGVPDGVTRDCAVRAALPPTSGALAVSDHWVGRVVDPLGRPLDGKGVLPRGAVSRPIFCQAPAAVERLRLGERLNLGVRALNLFTTCRRGQRLGLFAGPGVGKSTLLAMLARNAICDVIVLALVGERGREVREFLEDDLGPIGLRRAVVVVATSDAPPLMRREAAYAAMTIAEYFRDQGKSVLLLLDSVTRYCHALREIGIAADEPLASRGYPSSMYAELPRILERAGPGPQGTGKDGYITAIFTVLVEGDDLDEPVADTVRGILDGHVILDRRISDRGRFPAVDVLRSLSRSVPGCNSDEENALTRTARAVLATHDDMADMIRLGAYRAGTNPEVDRAVEASRRVEEVLQQDRAEAATIEGSFNMLRDALATFQ